VTECIDFLSALPPQGSETCPFPFKGQTVSCRVLHAFSSFIRPDVHCFHTAPISPVCRNKCLPECANCPNNSHCIPVFPNLFQINYKCQCNNGYTNVDGSCVANTCNSGGRCGAAKTGTYTCGNDNICRCLKSFTWDDSQMSKDGQDACRCLNGETWKNNSANDKSKMCVPVGRCTIDNHCTIQDHKQVQCQPYGINIYTPWDHCLCNYGFVGGSEFPCSCINNRTVVHSNILNAEICIGDGECVKDADCSQSSHCSIPNGKYLGACV